MELNNKLSVLKLKSVYIESFSFNRKQHIDSNSIQPRIFFRKKIEELNSSDISVLLSVSIKKDDDYSLDIDLKGIFEIEPTELSKEVLLERNAVAILFPYLRSQITLLTSQPSFQPIVLPVININAVFDSENE